MIYYAASQMYLRQITKYYSLKFKILYYIQKDLIEKAPNPFLS